MAASTMPSLEAVLQALAETRIERQHAILQARSESLELNDHDRNLFRELGIAVPEDAVWPLDGDSADLDGGL